MKNMLKYILILATAGLIFPGCDKIKDFGDTNANPNASTEPITAALLTSAISNLGSAVWGGGSNINGGLYCQYMSETQYTDASRYAKPTTSWDAYYVGPMYDLQNIINYNSNPDTKDKAATSGSNASQIAIARILKAYYYMVLTDAWGDLPYFGALQGKGDVPFDDQQAVYADLLKELKEAANQFDGGPTVKGDIMYSGNTTKWKKFANSVRAIIALRMSKADAAKGKTEFANAIAGGVIDANADNAKVDYPGGSYTNPIYGYYVLTQRFDYAISETLTDALSTLSDPRINVYGSDPTGFPYGLTRNDALAWQTANPVYGFLYAYTGTPQDMDMFLLTAGQVYLARAEAAKLGWTAESALTNYTSGITLEMNRWGITNGTTIANYLAQPSVLLVGDNTDYAKIGTQRWLAHYPDGNQGWAEWRRTGFPALTPAPGAGKPIPRRLPYGPNDAIYNPTNYAAAAAKYTVGGEPDSQDAKIWWDN